VSVKDIIVCTVLGLTHEAHCTYHDYAVRYINWLLTYLINNLLTELLRMCLVKERLYANICEYGVSVQYVWQVHRVGVASVWCVSTSWTGWSYILIFVG